MPRQEYTDYINLLTQQEEMKDSVVANLIATGWIMQMAPENEPIRRNEITKAASRLLNEPAFKALMTDPKVEELARQGKIVDLETLLAEKATMVDDIQAYRKAARGPENARGDAQFLKSAIKDLKDQVKKAPPMKQKQSARFQEMITQMEAAQMKCERGEGLTGDDAKAMMTAVQKYNDKGTRTPGGTKGKKAVGFTTCMCMMQRFMPENKFNQYCDALSKTHKNHVFKRGDFGIERITGATKSAQEWQRENEAVLRKNMSQEAMAVCVATAKLAGRNREAPIEKRVLDAEVKSMMQPGSAFQRAMKDPEKVREYKKLAQEGKSEQLGRMLYRDCQVHAARTSSFQFNRSVRALTGGNLNSFMTQAHLANILAASELASKADPSQTINIGAFRQRAAEISVDPAFQRIAARYQTDPSYRQRINVSLTGDGTAQTLQAEYEAAQKPVRRKEAPQPAPGV